MKSIKKNSQRVRRFFHPIPFSSPLARGGRLFWRQAGVWIKGLACTVLLLSSAPASSAEPGGANGVGAVASSRGAALSSLPTPQRFGAAVEERGDMQGAPSGMPKLASLPSFQQIDKGRCYTEDSRGTKTYYSVDPVLQARAESLLRAFTVPWGSIVALDPKSGRVLAIASYSSAEPNGPPVATRATFPAASLFKVVTSAAAVEIAGLRGDNLIHFRGGNYVLGPTNYLPDPRKDSRIMSLADALGKSVNPVFARVALNNLSGETLKQYAQNFGFNSVIPFEAPLQPSSFTVGYDNYDIARTAAGFGSVFVSPVHAAMIAAAVGNGGRMLRPYLVESIEGPQGEVQYRARPSLFKNVVLSSTSTEVLRIMQSTVETGTARKHFVRFSGNQGFQVAGKTGTLSGTNPKGLYHWFIATAPVSNPTIAIATLVIDPGNARTKAVPLGSRFLQYYHALQTQGLAAAERTVREGPSVIRRPKSREAVVRAPSPRSPRAASNSLKREGGAKKRVSPPPSKQLAPARSKPQPTRKKPQKTPDEKQSRPFTSYLKKDSVDKR